MSAEVAPGQRGGREERPGRETPGAPDQERESFAPGHRAVFLEPAVTALAPHRDGTYIDATFGGGGHTRALLKHDPPVGKVYAIDADADAIARAHVLAREPSFHNRLVPVHANFGSMREVATSLHLDRVDGVLMDLGLSSYQLDQSERGFSFRFEAPLDMRFDRGAGRSARDVVNDDSEAELAATIWRFGEEPKSRQIAAAIVRERAREPIMTTTRLAEIVERAAGGRRGRATHPATRTFQAIRMAVNAELESLEGALRASVDLLAAGGRLVVISFHSLEDRLVKQFIAAEATVCICPPAQPICTCDTIPRLRRIGGAAKPTATELAENSRSRSAIMRVAERLDANGQAIGRGG